MPNNIAVSITADVADLTVKRAIMSAELKAATKDLNDFAKTANAGGLTDELQTAMLGAADKAAKLKNQIGLLDQQSRSLAGATAGVASAAAAETAVTEVSTAAHASNRAAFEGLVLVHEALSGRFHRMAGSALILGQAMAGEAATASILTAALSPVGIAVIGGTAAMAAAVVATLEYQAAMTKLRDISLGVGAVSGLTADQIEDASERASAASGTMVGEQREFAASLVEAGIRGEEQLTAIQSLANGYAKLRNIPIKEAMKELAKSMADPAKGAVEINDKLQIWDDTQLRLIETAAKSNDKQQAQALITAGLAKLVGEADQATGGLASSTDKSASAFSAAWTALSKLNEQYHILAGIRAAAIGELPSAPQQHDTGPFQQRRQTRAQALADQSGGAKVADDTPEAREQQQFQGLKDQQAALEKGVAASKTLGDTASYQRQSAALQEVRDAIARVTDAQGRYIDAAARAHEVAQLEIQQAEAKHAHNQQEVADLGQKIALLKAGDEVRSSADIKREAQDQGALESARSKPPSQPKSQVSAWTEQLDAIKGLQQNWYADQEALTAQYWQKIVASGQGSAKDRLEAENKLQEALKAVDKESVDAAIDTAKEKAEAAGGNVAQVEAIYAALEARLKASHAEGGKEWEKVEKEKAEATKKATDEAARQQRAADQTQLEELKANLASQAEVRKAQAGTAEAQVSEGAKSAGPLGEIQAAQRIAAIKAQLRAQEMADDAATYQAEDALRQRDIAAELAASGAESTAYKNAVNAKMAADNAYYAQKRAKDAQDVAAQIADQQKIAAAWHATIDPVMNQTGSAIQGLINHTQTWRQTMLQIGEAIESAIIGAIVKMAAQWVVSMIVGQTAAQTSNASVAASYAGVAGAAGVASMAAAPFPLDLTAPAFGAEMSAVAAGFASAASLAVGTNYVPNDMMAQIHAGERVIPAADNRALMAAINNPANANGGANGVRGAAGGLGGGGSGGRPINLAINALNSRDVKRTLNTAAGRSMIRKMIKDFD